MDEAKDDLKSHKGFNVTKFFYGGHSLGGASTTAWVHDNFNDAEGAFAWGAYVSSKVEDPAKNFG